MLRKHFLHTSLQFDVHEALQILLACFLNEAHPAQQLKLEDMRRCTFLILMV